MILSIGLVFAKGASLGHFELLAPAVYVLAALTVLITTIQRIVHVRRQLQSRSPSSRCNKPAAADYLVCGCAARPSRSLEISRRELPQ